MEGEPDRARIAARLPDARDRMKHIKESADSLRFAAQDRARQFDAEAAGRLRGRIDIETGALRHWTPSTWPNAARPLGGCFPGPRPVTGCRPKAGRAGALHGGR